jgi:hypothetical protein
MPPEPAAAPPQPAPPLVDPAEARARDEVFTSTPDPWQALVLLEYGGDRTFETTVSRMVIEAEPAQRAGFEEKLLIALRRPELTAAGRQAICRLLGLVGGAASVPVLAPLLADPRTSDDARLALDGIDVPEVAAAYRAALPQTRGRTRLGLIGSIALRRDSAAVDALTQVAIDEREPAEVRDVAEAAVKQLTAATARP